MRFGGALRRKDFARRQSRLQRFGEHRRTLDGEALLLAPPLPGAQRSHGVELG